MAVGFESDHFHSQTIYRIFGVSQMLASIGGFLSLIGGVSLISLFEILYFFGCCKKKSNQIKSVNLSNAVSQTPKNALSTFFIKYCKFSSIHGLNNATEGKFFGFMMLITKATMI